MNTIFKLKKVFLILLLLCIGTVKAQFVNGDFVYGTPSTTINNWSHPGCQYVAAYTYLPEDAWIDMTGTGFGAGKWLEQSVYTSPCMEYEISFDLSAWNGWDHWDAGVNVTIDGSALGGRLSTADFSGSPVSWHRMTTIRFRGTGTSRAFRFTCNSNLIQSFGDGRGVGVIAFDDVRLDSFPVDCYDSFRLDTSHRGCNYFCFDLKNLKINSGGSFSNIVWKINGNVVQNGGMQHCRKFAKSNSPQTVRVEFDFTDEDGNVHHEAYTVYVTPNENCPCDFDQHISLVPTYHPCDQYEFDLQVDPGYVVECTHWTIDGVKVNDGSLRSYAPGHHKVCVIAIGHAEGEVDNACCGTRCYEFDVPDIITDEITRQFCDLAQDGYMFDPCAELPGYASFTIEINGQLVSGPCPSSSYLLAEGQYTINLYDADGCLRKTVTINIVRQHIIETICDLGIILVDCEPRMYTLEDILQRWLQEHPSKCHCNGDQFQWFEDGRPIDPNKPYTFQPGATRTFEKVYYDPVHCTRCIYKFTVRCNGGVDGTPVINGNNGGNGTQPGNESSQQLQHSYKIIPNPASRLFQVSSSAGYEVYQLVEIKDMTGKIVLSKTHVNSTTYFDMSAFPAGSYVVVVTTDTGSVSLKLLTLQN